MLVDVRFLNCILEGEVAKESLDITFINLLEVLQNI